MATKKSNNTLLVDGNALFKTAYYGAKRLMYNNEKIGGIYLTLSIIRKLINENKINKIVVVWDGENSIGPRALLYPWYKENRLRDMTPDEEDNYHFQKSRVKQYLEELFIRQHITEDCEADDAIAYYTQNKIHNENVIVVTNDRDLLQLLDERTSVYLIDKKEIINQNNFRIFFPYHYKNVKVIKILTGDRSDNIHGIRGLACDEGIERVIGIIPEICQREITLDEVFESCEKNKDQQICKNILTGKSARGIFGKEFFDINEKIINLDNPLIDDKNKSAMDVLIKEKMDPTDRRFKNLLKMMIKDGTIQLIPGKNERWEEFVQPFIKIVRHEKHD